MTTNDRLYVLFPYQILPDRDLRQLALFFPMTRRLQLLEPLPVPPWGSSHLKTLSVELNEERAEQLRRAQAGFREFAAVHQDHCLAASYTSEAQLRQNWESRFEIQSSLRGGDARTTGPENRAILEAALFLKMAAEFDLKQAELETDLARAAHLETEFREILGIEEEDALEDTLETLAPALAASRAHLSFMLPRRIASWLQVFSLSPAAPSPLVLVTVSQDVVDEVLDKVEALGRHRPSTPGMAQIPVAVLPSPPSVPPEDFEAKLSAVMRTPEHHEYRRALEDLMRTPEDPAKQKALASATAELGRATEAAFGAPGSGNPVTRIGLTVFSNLTLADLALAMDSGGSPLPPSWADTPAPPILCLAELPDLSLSEED